MKLNNAEKELLSYIYETSDGDTSKMIPLEDVRNKPNVNQERIDRAIDSLQTQGFIKLIYIPNVYSITTLGLYVAKEI